MRHLIAFLAAALVAAAATACSSPTSPTPGAADFVIDVAGERFTLRLANAEAIQQARDNLAGRNTRFPAGPLRPGHGGFNQPWTWHLDPIDTRFVEVAIELCDGRPSYVERHQADYPTYCPWGARVVAER